MESEDGKKSVRSLFPMKRAWDAGPVAAAQECNVAYVAWTRAKVMTTPVRVESPFDGNMEWWWEACMDESPQNVPESDSEADDAPEGPKTPGASEETQEVVASRTLPTTLTTAQALWNGAFVAFSTKRALPTDTDDGLSITPA